MADVSLGPCLPQNCLEIPPALPPPSPTADDICGWFIDWYRIWPITFPLDGTGLSAAALASALNSIANAGGRVLDINLFFKDQDGNCTLEVSILYPNPGNPGQSQYQVKCPPGWTWDPVQERCVASIVIIPPPPTNGGGGNGKCDAFSNPDACCPKPSTVSKPCVVLCGLAGFLTPSQCLQVCCMPPPDPPLTDGITEMFARRPNTPLGKPARLSQSSLAGERPSYLTLMRPRNGPPQKGFG